MSTGRGAARILVAEDDTSLRRLLEILLGTQGYEVRSVGDGADALEAIDEWTPDAMVCDVMMPRLSGLSVCRELRAREEFASLPIVLLTARCFDEDIQAVLDLGGITFMNKPFNPTQLQEALQAMLPHDARGEHSADLNAKPAFGWLTPHGSRETQSS